MLAITMTMSPVQTQATESCLPLTERFLQERPDHFNAVSAWSDTDTEYRSVLDCLYVGVFPHAQKACHAYYTDEGLPLRQLHSDKYLRQADKLLLRFITQSYDMFADARYMDTLFPHLTEN